jgi:formylglycine-generating enzyme required for sulfatase activity
MSMDAARTHLRSLLPVLLILAAVVSAPAQKPADVLQKEEAFASAKKAQGEAERALRSAYAAMERALAAAREGQGAVWTAEMKRVLEPLANAAVAAVQKKASRAQVQAIFKREAPVALKKIENKDLLLFEPVLAARLATLSAEGPLDAAGLEAGSLAGLVLGDLLGAKPFHEFWNETFFEGAPAADAYRKSVEQLDKAKWDLDVAKDPVLQWQRGAPAGFAKVPSGTYYALGTSGFGAQGSRKGKRPVTLSRDVFLGLREVTNAEFFEWWKGLDAETRKKHLPADATGQPLWPTPDGAEGPAVTEEIAQKPVAGVTLATALSYAASRGARLPTEAEWCAAAGGREGRLYPWGDAWQADMCNDLEKKVNDTVPVASLPGRGPFGHFDLAGNVAEWTSTYEAGKDIDPAKIEDANAVIRGGSFAKSKDEVSNGWLWYGRALFDRTRDTGFRLAMDSQKK